MKRFVSLMLILLLLLCAAGCRQEEAQTPSTTAPAEATEPQLTLSARELYWKMRSALGMKYPYRYAMEQVMTYTIGTGELAMESEIRDVEQVIYSADPMHFNIATERTEVSLGNETVDRQAIYYRSKGSNKAEMYIYCGEPWDEWIYWEPTDYSYSRLEEYQRVLHPTEYPEDMTLDPETQMVGDREAYVLRYSNSAMEILNEEVPEEAKEELEKLQVEQVLYIDKENYMLLQTAMELHDVGEAVSKAFYWAATGVEYTNKKHPLTVTSFTKTYNGLDYDQVEVPPIPEEAYQALEGFGAT